MAVAAKTKSTYIVIPVVRTSQLLRLPRGLACRRHEGVHAHPGLHEVLGKLGHAARLAHGGRRGEEDGQRHGLLLLRHPASESHTADNAQGPSKVHKHGKTLVTSCMRGELPLSTHTNPIQNWETPRALVKLMECDRSVGEAACVHSPLPPAHPSPSIALTCELLVDTSKELSRSLSDLAADKGTLSTRCTCRTMAGVPGAERGREVASMDASPDPDPDTGSATPPSAVPALTALPEDA